MSYPLILFNFQVCYFLKICHLSLITAIRFNVICIQTFSQFKLYIVLAIELAILLEFE